MSTSLKALIAAIIAPFALAAYGGTEQPDKATPGAPALPPTPTVQLAPIGDFEDSAAHTRAISGRIDELVGSAKETDDPVLQVGYLLAAGNEILAHQLEPGCTAMLLGITGQSFTPTADELRDALSLADALLGQTEGILVEVRSATDLPDGWLSKTRRQLDTLQAFAQALRAYVLDVESTDRARLGRQAASRLSALLEDDDKRTVAAASLWQACLRSRSSDPARVMSLLDLPLANPQRKTLPFAFFARLLRCRLLADTGAHAAAMALLTQMEERCDEWFAGAKDRDDAIRATTLVEIGVLRDWHRHLMDAGSASSRQWCIDRIRRISDERFTDGARTVLRLVPTIPIIATAPTRPDHTKATPRPGD